MTGEAPRRRSRIGDELDKLHREEEKPAYGIEGQPKKRRGVFRTMRDFFKDLLVRQTSTKR